MPVSNPLIDLDSPDADPVVQQGWRSGSVSMRRPTGGGLMNPAAGTQNTSNAAGTSENVAVHVAMLVAFALIGVYVLRQSGFKFVVAGSVGVGG